MRRRIIILSVLTLIAGECGQTRKKQATMQATLFSKKIPSNKYTDCA